MIKFNFTLISPLSSNLNIVIILLNIIIHNSLRYDPTLSISISFKYLQLLIVLSCHHPLTAINALVLSLSKIAIGV